MSERKRRSLADTLRSVSPISGDTILSTVQTMRLITAHSSRPAPPNELILPENKFSATPTSPLTTITATDSDSQSDPAEVQKEVTGANNTGQASEHLARPVTEPVIEPVTKPVTEPQGHSASHSASHSANHSASHSASHSTSLSLDHTVSHSRDHSLNQSTGQTYVSDKLTSNQKAVLNYLIINRPRITRFAQIGMDLNLGEATVRTILRRLTTLDFISFKRARDGQIQGVSIKLNSELCDQFYRDQNHREGGSRTLGQSLSQSLSQPLTRPLTRPVTSLDREIKNNLSIEDGETQRLLFITDERAQFQWPNLFRIGFGADQVRQVIEGLVSIGKPTERVLLGLDHADWELGQNNGSLTDSHGQLVSKPAGYIFNSLAKTGYYRRPSGYVSAEEQAEKDAAETATKVLEARKFREHQEFQLWLGGMTQEERENIRRKYPAGPDEPVFRIEFAKRNN